MNDAEAKVMAARWWAETLPAEKREPFIVALVKRLPEGKWTTYNDYDPDEVMVEALREAGIPCRGCMFSGRELGFPSKTGVSWDGVQLFIKQGYGAEWVPFEQRG